MVIACRAIGLDVSVLNRGIDHLRLSSFSKIFAHRDRAKADAFPGVRFDKMAAIIVSNVPIGDIVLGDVVRDYGLRQIPSPSGLPVFSCTSLRMRSKSAGRWRELPAVADLGVGSGYAAKTAALA